jgi:RHS repeat-associated protein
VYARWTAHSNRATDAKYMVSHATGQATVTVDQQQAGGAWNLLGTFSFGAGAAQVTLTDQANGYVIADAVRFVPLAGQQTGSTMYYVHADHLNTPRVVSNEAQQVAWRWDNTEPFGKSLPEENPSGLGTFEFPLRFPGQYFDRETNTVQHYFRDYDPTTGRYMESDPIGLEGGVNTYAYALGAPTSIFDLLGLYTTQELSNIIFNETQSLTGAGLIQAQVAIGQVAINREVPGVVDPGIAPSRLNAKSLAAIRAGVPSVVSAYNQATQAAALALCRRDPTGGAKGFVLKGNPTRIPRYGKYPVISQFGPFSNSFPTIGNPNVPLSQQLPATGIYINIFAQ